MEESTFYTDLALERKSAKGLCEGFSFREVKKGSFAVSHLKIEEESAAKTIQKPIGDYYTVSFPSPDYMEKKEKDGLVSVLAETIKQVSPSKVKRLLVVGLGNRNLTADSIGPKIADSIPATAHLKQEKDFPFPSLLSTAVYVCVPGVMAQSGMEAAEAVKAYCSLVLPDLVLVFDALAAQNTERLLRTVQICNTGICPGSGIGCKRQTINQETLGAPVVAVGVPTVVNAKAFVREALSESERESAAIQDFLTEKEDFFVSPRTLDIETEALVPLLASAVNRLFGFEIDP
ncbi:MAG: GPR endopeptidase [Clostridia bacterium]|nr:GPR endopeptidase [Clostridia bacterium]